MTKPKPRNGSSETASAGFSNQLTRQIGEHLVAAQLGRMGYVASPFAGNVPLFDVLAADQRGYSIPIQVKAINGASWQYQADTFLKIKIIGKFQHVQGKKPLLNAALVCIFILLHQNEPDEFFIFRLRDLQNYTFQIYKSRKRPNNPKSFHCAVLPKHLKRFKDNWQLVKNSFDERFVKTRKS